MAKLLPNEVIEAVYKAAASAGLKRDDLLAGLPLEFASTLTGTQILTDLLRLNQIERFADGTVPLREWLETAKLLAGLLPAADVFREALRQLSAGASQAPTQRPPAPSREDESREQELVGQLLAMFSTAELLRLVRYLPEGRALEAELPGPNTAVLEMAHAVIDLLQRRAALDGGFFDALVRERPNWSGAIDRLRRKFLG